MARPVTALVIFFVAFNLFASAIPASAIGIDATVGEDQAINQQVEQGQNVSSGAPTGSTLFGLYNVLADQAGGFFSTVYPGLRMLERVGVPKTITQGILGPLFSVMIFVGIASFLRGWGL